MICPLYTAYSQEIALSFKPQILKSTSNGLDIENRIQPPLLQQKSQLYSTQYSFASTLPLLNLLSKTISNDERSIINETINKSVIILSAIKPSISEVL